MHERAWRGGGDMGGWTKEGGGGMGGGPFWSEKGKKSIWERRWFACDLELYPRLQEDSPGGTIGRGGTAHIQRSNILSKAIGAETLESGSRRGSPGKQVSSDSAPPR